METPHKGLIILILCAVVCNSLLFAQSQQPANKEVCKGKYPILGIDGTGVEKFRDWFHNPTDWLSMDADIRWEWFYGWNIDTLKDDAINKGSKWHYTLNRFRWAMKAKITDDMDFNMRWVWEFRTWDDPPAYDKEVDFDEIIPDRFNLTIRNLGNMPLTLTVGRQDIIFGTGWLILDGTPADEGRTIYFDAARLTYQVPDRDTTLDFIYIEQRAHSSDWLKPIGSSYSYRSIAQSDSRGAIVYVTDKTNPDLQLEGYYILKNDNPRHHHGRKASVSTFGGAVSGPIGSSEHWRYRVEGAIQTGSINRKTMDAIGTNNRIEYHFNDAKKNEIHACFEYLTGDDPGTDKNEGFDILWGEWPQWSTINSYVYWPEEGPSHVTNLQRIGIGHSFWLTENTQMCTDYHLLWADENTHKNTATAAGTRWSDDGKFRGQLLTCRLRHSFTKNLKACLVFEYFIPGNYYDDSSRDDAYHTDLLIEYTF